MEKEIGTFTAKSTSITKSSQHGGAHNFQLNVEGNVTGEFEGVLLTTMNLTTNNLKSGTFGTDGAVYLKNGDIVVGIGVGVFSATGGHRWKLLGHILLGDGRLLRSESEIDLASRSWSGKIYA